MIPCFSIIFLNMSLSECNQHSLRVHKFEEKEGSSALHLFLLKSPENEEELPYFVLLFRSSHNIRIASALRGCRVRRVLVYGCPTCCFLAFIYVILNENSVFVRADSPLD